MKNKYFFTLKLYSIVHTGKFYALSPDAKKILTTEMVSNIALKQIYSKKSEFGSLCGSDFTSAEFRGIPRNSAEIYTLIFPYNSEEFRVFSYTEFRIRNLSGKFIQ
jgi:hypothetical protein